MQYEMRPRIHSLKCFPVLPGEPSECLDKSSPVSDFQVEAKDLLGVDVIVENNVEAVETVQGIRLLLTGRSFWTDYALLKSVKKIFGHPPVSDISDSQIMAIVILHSLGNKNSTL